MVVAVTGDQCRAQGGRSTRSKKRRALGRPERTHSASGRCLSPMVQMVGSYGKRSHWQAHVSIAARGIQSFRDQQRADRLGMYPKALARLENTSADIAYWNDWWRNGDWAMRPRYEVHPDRYDVDYANATKALGEAKRVARGG